MSKRLTRLRPDNLPGQLENKTGTALHVVLVSGQTIFGTFEGIDEKNVNIRDTRHHHHQILISNIFEVIFDFVSL